MVIAIGAAVVGAAMMDNAPEAEPKTAAAEVATTSTFEWTTVVNNNDAMPGAPGGRTFNSYNQPSVNRDGLVVFRARSRGGPPLGQPTHGIYTRDMSWTGSPIVRILDRTTPVPQPNNVPQQPDELLTTFSETPSFPRIDMNSATIATRGNHQPVWRYVPEGEPDKLARQRDFLTGAPPEAEGDETRAGTTGIYTNPFGHLVTAASKLGAVPEFSFFEVPEYPGTLFEVFPGAPAITGFNTIVFKGNYTTPSGGTRTGVYYRVIQDRAIGDDDLAPAGGDSPVVLVASSDSTLIPGTRTVFGSTAPPSAAKGRVVFAGFDDEDNPTLGGLYQARLQPTPELTALVSIGGPVPGESRASTFNRLGEGGAFDGRFIGFWGAWGEETRTVRLYCATEGNRDRIAYCNQALQCADTGEILGDPGSVCDDESDPFYGERCYQEREVPLNQGLFIHDNWNGKTHVLAKTPGDFDDFLFWNFSGKTPCTGAGHHGEEGGEDDGEPARWRSSAFVAISGRRGPDVWGAFKARTGELSDHNAYIDPVDGIYLDKRPGSPNRQRVMATRMAGNALDPEAPAASVVTELGIEREGFRGEWLVINASMAEEGGEEDEGVAGIYITRVP
jgi:hypothetical protein